MHIHKHNEVTGHDERTHRDNEKRCVCVCVFAALVCAHLQCVYSLRTCRIRMCICKFARFTWFTLLQVSEITSHSGEMHNTHTHSSNSSCNLVVATVPCFIAACGSCMLVVSISPYYRHYRLNTHCFPLFCAGGTYIQEGSLCFLLTYLYRCTVMPYFFLPYTHISTCTHNLTLHAMDCILSHLPVVQSGTFSILLMPSGENSLYHIIIMSVDYIILLSMRRVGFLIAIAYYCLRLWCTTSCIYLQGCVALKKGNNSRMCNIGMV